MRNLAVVVVVIPTMARRWEARYQNVAAKQRVLLAHDCSTHENCLFSREQVYYLQ